MCHFIADRVDAALRKILPEAEIFRVVPTETIIVEFRPGTKLTFNQLTAVRDTFHTHDIVVRGAADIPLQPRLVVESTVVLEINNWALMKTAEV